VKPELLAERLSGVVLNGRQMNTFWRCSSELDDPAGSVGSGGKTSCTGMLDTAFGINGSPLHSSAMASVRQQYGLPSVSPFSIM